MPDLINVNGAIGAASAASISPLDRGFLFGDSVYETLRTYGGVPFRLGAHVERLRRSAARLDIDPGAAPGDPGDEILRTLAAADHGESAVRVVLSRGVGPIGYDPAGCGPPTLVVFVRPLPPLPPSWTREGVDVAVVAVARNARASLDPAIKSSNLLNNFLAWREGRRLRVDEPILLNVEGRLAEGATSNLFLIRDGEVRTPPLDDGLLAGVTRAAALELLARERIPASEASLVPDDLARADEAFLTSTLKGVLPIRRADGWPIREGRPGPITRRLMAAYEALVQEETKTGSRPGSMRR